MIQWQQEFKNSLRTSNDINAFFGTDLKDIEYNSFIPKSFAQKIKEAGPQSSLWKQFIPAQQENEQIDGMYDPIGDTIHTKAKQLIHRYKNRALFLPTTVCPIICRYCFRKNELTFKDELFKADFQNTIQYLKDHPEIEEIIFSGGDPLILSDEKLREYLEAFANVGIKCIRFHSRVPIIIPSRLNESLIELINEFSTKFKTITLVTHLNHSEEISSEVEAAITKLKKETNLLLLSQSVLLKNVNDNSDALADLFWAIHKIGIRPYYLHHPDLVKGGMHFHLDLETGRKIFLQLRDKIPGWLIPHYILDIPGGHGKTPAFNPESLEFTGSLIDRYNKIHSYPSLQ